MIPSWAFGVCGILALVTFRTSLAHSFRESDLPPKPLDWKSCQGDTLVLCTDVSVPLDYHDPAPNRTFNLRVAKLLARNSTKLGSIFLNPGGPGSSGVEILHRSKHTLWTITSDQYDIIAWDPRGVPRSRPQADCFKTAKAERAFWEGKLLHHGLEAPGDFAKSDDNDEFGGFAQDADQNLQGLEEMCKENGQNTLPYVGTAATVRDILEIRKALHISEPVNFWGFSYGTLIGLYLVNMFPQHVGKIVLEGVVDPEYWANKPAYKSWSVTATKIDATLEKFALECVQNAESCSFAGEIRQADKLLDKLQDLLTHAYKHKKAMGNRTEISSARIRKSILNRLPHPWEWIELSRNLSSEWWNLQRQSDGCLQPDSRRFSFDHWSTPAHDTTYKESLHNYAFQAVTCGDAVDSVDVTTETVFEELAQVARNVAPKLGPAWGEGGFYCHRWPYRAVERYTGPWNRPPQNSEGVLIIGNSLDPVTPYKSAEKVAHAFGGKAALVERKAHGHFASWDEHMCHKCTYSILNKYLLEGILPGPGSPGEVCQYSPFPTDNTDEYDNIPAAVQQMLNAGLELYSAVIYSTSISIVLAIAVGVIVAYHAFMRIYERKRFVLSSTRKV